MTPAPVLNQEFDIVVVGAGPAGSVAARTAAENGASVLLLERDPKPGTPVRCAEGVEKGVFEKILGFKTPEKWINAKIEHFRIFSPGGIPVNVSIGGIGYILDRSIFDAELADLAAKDGATLLTEADVIGVKSMKNGAKNVLVNYQNSIYEVKTKIVIAADGVESRVARWCGIDSTVPVKEMESFAQATLENIDILPDSCDFYFSNELMPQGYAWMFPKGNNSANIGLGICGSKSKETSAKEYLQIFISRYFPNGKVVAETVGGTPSKESLSPLVTDGLLIVGDAAHQVNPISFGGIVSGMFAGQVAGEVAARAIQQNDCSAKKLQDYPKQWAKQFGKTHRWYFKIKPVIYNFTDEEFDNIAREFNALPSKNQNMMHLFKIALKNRPGFLKDVIKIFLGF